MRNDYHDRHFARSCREAFGSDLDESHEPDNWRWTWPIVILYVLAAAFVVGWGYVHAAPIGKQMINHNEGEWK